MNKVNITNIRLAEHLDSMPRDSREIYLLSNGLVRLTAVNGTRMVAEMSASHNAGILETYVLGGAYIASALMASSVKGEDRIQLSVECAGAIGGIYTEAWASGEVRGYLKNNPVPLKKPLENWDLNTLYGPGFISVSKILEGAKTPFTGQVMMQYGNLAKDLALYYSESEQTPTTFSISVNFNKEGMLLSAGGFFLQAMPGCTEDVLTALEEKCENLPSLGEALKSGNDIKKYIEESFSVFAPKHLSTEDVRFHCPCDKGKYAGFLSRLPENEKQDILQKGPFPLELNCLNCGSKYSFSEEEIRFLFNKR